MIVLPTYITGLKICCREYCIYLRHIYDLNLTFVWSLFLALFVILLELISSLSREADLRYSCPPPHSWLSSSNLIPFLFSLLLLFFFMQISTTACWDLDNWMREQFVEETKLAPLDHIDLKVVNKGALSQKDFTPNFLKSVNLFFFFFGVLYRRMHMINLQVPERKAILTV